MDNQQIAQVYINKDAHNMRASELAAYKRKTPQTSKGLYAYWVPLTPLSMVSCSGIFILAVFTCKSKCEYSQQSCFHHVFFFFHNMLDICRWNFIHAISFLSLVTSEITFFKLYLSCGLYEKIYPQNIHGVLVPGSKLSFCYSTQIFPESDFCHSRIYKTITTLLETN